MSDAHQIPNFLDVTFPALVLGAFALGWLLAYISTPNAGLP